MEKKIKGEVARIGARCDTQVRKRLAYTTLVVVVSLTLAHIPVYGVNAGIVESMFASTSLLAFSDALSGGGLSQLAVGGFAVTSIIMAGILMQLISVVFPRFEHIRKLGEVGRRRYERISMGLACLMTLGMGIAIMTTSHSSLLYNDVGWMAVVPVLEWLAGTFVVAFMAQKVQDKGLGNGPTVILAANIVATLPDTLMSADWTGSGIAWSVIIAVIVLFLAMLMQESRIDVPLQQTRKPLSVMNAEGTLPMPLGISSVLPIVYASGIFMLPSILVAFGAPSDGILGTMSEYTSTSAWYSGDWQGYVALASYVVLIVLFSFFASRMTFSSAEVANRMRERGDVIVGVKPGEDTERYLERRRRKLALIGALMLVFIAVLPDIALGIMGLTNVAFAGTSLIIMVGAFWQLRTAYVGMTRHRGKKYRLFGDKEVA